MPEAVTRIEPMPDVRLAGPSDAQAVLECLFYGYLNDRVGLGLPPSPSKMRAFIEHILIPGNGFIGIIDGPEGIEATVGIETGSHWYSDVPMLFEKWVYVAPEVRGSRHLDALFGFQRRVKAECEHEAGQPVILITSLLTRERLAAKERVWGRYGEKIGAVYSLRDTP